jgi:hypothetical protein
MGLISRMTVRTIIDVSTAVVKAIHINSAPQLRKAIACAPWMKSALVIMQGNLNWMCGCSCTHVDPSSGLDGQNGFRVIFWVDSEPATFSLIRDISTHLSAI